MKELKDYYSDILEACRGCAEVGDEDDPISTGVGYEADEVCVHITFLASGRECEDGSLSNVRISVEEITGAIVNDYGDEEDFSDAELNDLSAYIEKELPSLLEEDAR
ncbi:MAG: hypothetical protein NC453_10615 [Muribaculum sp.]|nr:hypothetical protein [Muribaculum sp.]